MNESSCNQDNQGSKMTAIARRFFFSQTTQDAKGAMYNFWSIFSQDQEKSKKKEEPSFHGRRDHFKTEARTEETSVADCDVPFINCI